MAELVEVTVVGVGVGQGAEVLSGVERHVGVRMRKGLERRWVTNVELTLVTIVPISILYTSDFTDPEPFDFELPPAFLFSFSALRCSSSSCQLTGYKGDSKVIKVNFQIGQSYRTKKVRSS